MCRSTRVAINGDDLTPNGCRKYFMLFGIKMVDTSFVSKNNSDLAIDKLIEDIVSGQ